MTLLSTISGLVWSLFGFLLLITSIKCLIVGDTAAGHVLEFLIGSLPITAVGCGPVAVGVYALVVTKGFKLWNELPAWRKAVAVLAMAAILTHAQCWLLSLLSLL